MSKHQYSRRTMYPHKVGLRLDDATFKAVESVAQRAGWNIPETIRETLKRGLKPMRSALRPSKRPKASPGE